MRIVLCHFFNEEFLLPWWLEHHKKIFDVGVMIDYHSTDNSVNIIRSICPDWHIMTSKNTDFGAMNVDLEVEKVEADLFDIRARRQDDWTMCLNVTEFLYGAFDKLPTEGQHQIIVPAHMMVSKLNASYYSYEVPLTQHCTTGIPWYGQSHGGERAGRSFHNFKIDYPKPGRHYFVDESQLSKDFVIFHYGWAPMCSKLLARKLQIQTQIPAHDRENRLGWHHLTNEPTLINDWTTKYVPKAIDMSAEIQKWVELTNKSL